MAWIDALTDIVNRYAGGGAGTASAPADPHQDYCDIATTAPREAMAEGLSHAFRSEQTPSFAEMVSSLFRQSNPGQRAGLLNELIGSVGPAAVSSIPALKELAGKSDISRNVTPEMANQVSAEQVQRIANHAERNNPSIIDQVSGFYAQHPQVVKALGGAAISIAIQRIVRRS